MRDLEIAGVKITDISKKEFLDVIVDLIAKKEAQYIVTPYSEYILRAQVDPEFKQVINNAYLSLADGMGVLIGLKYLSLHGNKYLDLVKCLLTPFFNKAFLLDVVREKLSGSEIIYDICELAERKGYKLFLLGGFDFGQGCASALAKINLEKKYKKLNICGTYSGTANPEDEEVINKVLWDAKPDILVFGYGAAKGEKWIAKNYKTFPAMVSFPLGGTIDYLAGAKRKVPKFFADRGLEGLLRPFISERGDIPMMFTRLKRSWLGIIRFIWALLKQR